LYSGLKNSGVSFVNSLIKNITKLSDDYLHKIDPMRMTLDDQQMFHNSLNCSICQKDLGTDRLEIIVISQVALEVQPTINVTWIIMLTNSYQYFFIIFRNSTVIYLFKSWERFPLKFP